jgi:hypothetical protein
MGERVWVESFEALRGLRAALCRFAEVVGAGLAEADAELQRARAWVNVEQDRYWKEEAKKRAELLAKAKIALVGKKFQTTPLGGRPSCIEEEKELARATRRVEEAERKLASVHHWRRRFDEELFSYQGVASGLNQALTADIPRAIARLDNMLAALEAYAASPTPEMQGSVAIAGEGVGMGLAPELGSMARAAPSGSEEAREYERVRERTPSRALRDTVPTAALDESWRREGGPGLTWPAEFERLGLATVPVATGDKVVLERGAAGQARIYLERLATVSAGDSGWHVGSVDDVAAPVYDAACVADVLAARPDLAPILDLPPGCLVVLDGVALGAVFDAANKRLWPGEAIGPP